MLIKTKEPVVFDGFVVYVEHEAFAHENRRAFADIELVGQIANLVARSTPT